MTTRLVRFYTELISRHRGLSAALVGTAAMILGASVSRGHVHQAVVYLAAITMSVVVIDAIVLRRHLSGAPLPVRGPESESLMLVACWAIAMVWLIQRFVFNYRPDSAPVRLVWIVAGLGSVFAIIPALYFLARRYWPRDLGVRISGVVAALPVLAIFAAITFTFSRGSMTWSEIRQYTPIEIVLTAISAALPEEFFRAAWQTRIGAWMGSRAAGWLIASLAWALLHGPKDFSESRSIASAAIDVLNIVPLGLLWGYLTHRTRSFVPSMLLHGFNIWGLQNL